MLWLPGSAPDPTGELAALPQTLANISNILFRNNYRNAPVKAILNL